MFILKNKSPVPYVPVLINSRIVDYLSRFSKTGYEILNEKLTKSLKVKLGKISPRFSTKRKDQPLRISIRVSLNVIPYNVL
jgi:hypothetical protein